MAIKFEPKVGQVLECNYGDYQACRSAFASPSLYDYRLKPEMVKNRLVVVLNGKIDPNACIVVPLSSTRDAGKLSRGWHVELPAHLIEELPYFKQRTRWAKSDLVAQVSRERLFKPRQTGRGHLDLILTREVVERLQRAVIKVMNAASLLKI
ncbi:type II toxin-antitoxin system PemK/MazF family toxin [Pseudomonas sp. PAGU 2196]|uniref:type II toxin-antitoxin system PemK/MazF family toxin n=1 Tax=Pseudomonas sp. PAGU 2196 TaxID=2793997 RepID=UPI001EDDC40B|nr:type II toxin-antitoxin system PemK/MazF family toxin [Pseudomonas sp. PAGU 2196]